MELIVQNYFIMSAQILSNSIYFLFSIIFPQPENNYGYNSIVHPKINRSNFFLPWNTKVELFSIQWMRLSNSTNNTSSVQRMHYISTILKPYEFSLRKYIFLACLMTSVFQYLKFDGSINLRATVWWISPIV